MINFKELAAEAVGGSEVTQNRTKVDLKDVEFKYDGIVTIIGIDRFIKKVTDRKTGEIEERPFAVVAIAEEPVYFNGGVMFIKIFERWLAAYENDVHAMNADLQESGGVKIKMTTTTYNNAPFTNVEVIDE